jgi:hypothetical protein
MLDAPQHVLERTLSGEMQVAATGAVRFLKQIIRSRALKKEARHVDR